MYGKGGWRNTDTTGATTAGPRSKSGQLPRPSSVASAKEGGAGSSCIPNAEKADGDMTYVYLLQSEPHPRERYVGATAEFQQRLRRQ